jgi:integrase
MSFEHDLAIENSEELVLKPDARPTISYDDDEHYVQYVDAMYARSAVSKPPTEPDVLGPYFRKGAPYRAKVTPPHEPGLPTFSIEDVQKIMRHKPKGFYDVRLHVFILTLMDTGCRSGEAMGLRWPDVDFDNLLLKLHGKGAKDRLVPFSFELRRHLYEL